MADTAVRLEAESPYERRIDLGKDVSETDMKAALASGLAHGGHAQARRTLRAVWEAVQEAGVPDLVRFNPFLRGFGRPSSLAPVAALLSPYDFNPLNLNPLREVLNELVDFERVRACDKVQLFIGATNVETGRIRIFTNAELTADHVMASACLPQFFQAVTIDGVPYWDGGFTGNPALFPLFRVEAARDIVIVQTHPLQREGVPRSGADITARVNEINFNASLLAELRAIEFVGRLLDQQRLPEGRYRKMLVHNVSEGTPLTPLTLGGDLNTDLSFFRDLFTSGRSAADRWLAAHFDALGQRSTVDLGAMFHDAPVAGDAKPLR